MVKLESYDSEGPVTPETDDSTEVRPKCFVSSTEQRLLVLEDLLKIRRREE